MLHLIHPIVVHFSVAFLLVGSVTECGGIVARRERIERFGGALVLLGTVALVLTVVSGFLAHNSLAPPFGARAAIGRHENLALVTLAVYLVAALWKGWDGGRVRDGVRPLYGVWILLAGGLLSWTAWLGGHLVYGLGVGVP